MDIAKYLKEINNLKRFETLYRSIDQVRNYLIAPIDYINLKGIEIDEKYVPDYNIASRNNEMCCHIHAAVSQINVRLDSNSVKELMGKQRETVVSKQILVK